MAAKSSKNIRQSGLSANSAHSTQSGRRKIKPKEARVDQRKNKHGKVMTFRHLPVEDLEFQNERIQYNVDNPNRVAIRLQYLMDSTLVDLNSTSYMNKLYKGLVGLEETQHQKTAEARKLKEVNRVRNLVLNGDMLPPAGMEELYNNAALRVHRMLQRLDQYDRSLLVDTKPDRKIVPVEPFEYDSGGQYFVHLHKYGNTNYMPPEVVRSNQLKQKAKIQRARERLKAKLEQLVNPELSFIFKRSDGSVDKTTPNIINKVSNIEKRESISVEEEPDSFSGSPPDVTKKETVARRTESMLRKEQAHYVKNRTEMTLMFQDREREIAENKHLREQEKEAARERKQKRIEELHKDQEGKYMQMLQNKLAQRASMKPNLAAALNNISEASLESHDKDLEESASQKYIRQFYDVSPRANLEVFKALDNPLVEKLNNSDMEGPIGMFTYGHEVKLVYDREQAKTDEFLKHPLPQANSSQ